MCNVMMNTETDRITPKQPHRSHSDVASTQFLPNIISSQGPETNSSGKRPTMATRRHTWTSSSLFTLEEQYQLNLLASDLRVHDRDCEDNSANHSSTSDAFVVSTFQEKTPRKLDAQHLTSADLSSLKENDPFMYYSIPAVRQAVMKGRVVDFDVEVNEPVKRCSAISFENDEIDEEVFNTGNLDHEVELFMSAFVGGADHDDGEDLFMSRFGNQHVRHVDRE